MTFEQYEQHKEHIHELIVAEYFGKYWKGKPMQFEQSGSNLIVKLNDLLADSVLDVGCGYNEYKPHTKCNKFIGIDPYNDKADVKVGIEEYQTDEQFDVVLVLGSINFGTKSKIMREFEAVDRLTKKGGHIFVRVNPGITHVHTEYPLIELVEFYPWSVDDINEIALKFGYQILELEEETNRSGDKRLFFHFYK